MGMYDGAQTKTCTAGSSADAVPSVLKRVAPIQAGRRRRRLERDREDRGRSMSEFRGAQGMCSEGIPGIPD